MTIEKFGETETENWAEESLKCRQIVTEILNFGISQRQILKLLYLLSLELENRELMVQLAEIIKNSLDDSETIDENTGIIT